MASPSSLRQLSDIIAQAVTDIEAEYAKASARLPSLDEPFNPTNAAEAVGMHPNVVVASSLVIAAAAQITATVSNPALAIINDSLLYHLSSCLRATAALNVVEILREGGPGGLHVQEIAKKARTDPDKLARVLRLLATHHVFREVTPDVFANNRISSVIDKGKPSELCFEKPSEKYIGTSGLGAYLEHITDEGMKSSSYMTDALVDPATAFSEDPTSTPFSRAFSTTASMFAWYESPENKERLVRFGVGQAGSTKIDPPESILLGLKWNQLPKDAVLVDVGGGVGSTSLIIAKATPNLRIVNQDRAPVLEQAKAYWSEHLKSHVDSKMVEFQVHDFFTPQPVKNADIFMLRQIVHDWPDDAAIKILSHLRAAAAPKTKLVIVDQIIPYATESDLVNSIPGMARPPPPAPLLRNMGAAMAVPYWADLHMYALLNGRERTMGGFVKVCEKSGWKIVQVYHLPGSLFSETVAVPA
ncbi:O-methyltransferase [Mycena alexandri]|uniref:O-methyltransferase n=1 Tax=Mycena alexandri TaxID=1745969 RepID=A0AAD6TKU9_9AGAR|nr:O-methyltransferase [Mycena alexandri]